MATKTPTAERVIPGQPIQWHLQTSRHDYCPQCGSKIAFLGRRKRMCLGVCAVTLTLTMPTTSWLRMVAPPPGGAV